MNEPLIMSIDTSCDETSVAVTRGQRILSNVITSQVRQHAQFGGVVPMLAAKLHHEQIERVANLALQRARVTWTDFNFIAVTYGPGLAPALQVGIEFAKAISNKYKLPILPVNHMAGHIASVVAASGSQQPALLTYPLLALLVSGGHTELVLLEHWNKVTVLGETHDDAVGEAYDKVAKMLGLGYPGGAVLATFADEGNPNAFDLPVPMRRNPDLHFSYSGLKNAVRLLLEEEGAQLTKETVANVAASFQRVALQHLLDRVNKALVAHPEVTTLALAGGVAANLRLRKQLRNVARQAGVTLLVPANSKLCTDNAAMIGVAAWLNLQAGLLPVDAERIDRVPYLRLDQENLRG